MTVGRTFDTRVLIDTGTELGELDNLLGLTIEGETATSRQAYLGQTWEQAMVHAVGGGVSIDTMYQTAAFETFISEAALSAEGALLCVVCAEPPASWELIPVSWARPGYEAPPDDAITRTWAFDRNDVSSSGVKVSSFAVNGNAATTIAKGLDDSDGTTGVIVLTSAKNVTGIALTGRTGLPTYEGVRTGIRQFTVASGAAADLKMKLTGSSASATGFVLQGDEQELPDG